uniref:Uncharacterized protein n=1 Tax=viral metagenome TaxID=1070528 RepID=A0A6C0D757_9ZZZZ
MVLNYKNILFKELCDSYSKVLEKPIEQFIDSDIKQHDIDIFKNEANQESPFDKLNLKKHMYDLYTQGKASIVSKKISNARVCIVTENVKEFYPWNTWSTVFQWMGVPKDSSFWQIYIYSSKVKRVLPNEGPIGPEHLNGGYTYACKSDCIVIYRYEEATRVLIHELLHASCTDNMNNSVELREAATEMWAELFLVTILAKGNYKKTLELWNIQDHYIQDLNYSVKTFHSVTSAQDYGARYTTLREDILDNFKLYLDISYKPKRTHMSRFTSPNLDTYLN